MLTKDFEDNLSNIGAEAEKLINAATSPEETRLLAMMRFMVELNLAIVDILNNRLPNN
jgi:hypothetical protein